MFDRFDVWRITCLLAIGIAGRTRPSTGSLAGCTTWALRTSPILSKRSLSDNGRCILAGLIRKARRGESVGR
jgi:hypothetical protein